MNKLADQANAIVAELDTELVERRRETKLLVLSVIARANMILMGDAGTAKSMLVDQFMSHIKDANLYKTMVTKDTRPDQLFGPMDVAALRKGEYLRKIERKLPSAHLGFIDETTRASGVILDGCLNIINEHEFDNGSGIIDCPLWSLIGAANDWPGPDRTDLRAFLDRLGVRLVVDHVRTREGLLAVLDGQLIRNHDGQKTIAKTHTTLTATEIESLQAEATTIGVPDHVREKLVELRGAAEAEGQITSLRRMFEGVRLMQAQAMLRGDTEVADTDLRLFEVVLPSSVNPNDLKIAAELTLAYASPLGKEAAERRQEFDGVLDDLGALEAKIDPNAVMPTSEQMGDAGKISHRLTNLHERVTETRGKASDDDDTTDLDTLIGDIERSQRTIEGFLGIAAGD